MSVRIWLIVVLASIVFVELMISAATGTRPFEGGLWVFGLLAFLVGPRIAMLIGVSCAAIGGACLIRAITLWLSRRS